LLRGRRYLGPPFARAVHRGSENNRGAFGWAKHERVARCTKPKTCPGRTRAPTLLGLAVLERTKQEKLVSDSPTRRRRGAPALPRGSARDRRCSETCKSHSASPLPYLSAPTVASAIYADQRPLQPIREQDPYPWPAANHCGWLAIKNLPVSGEGPAQGSPAARHMYPGSRHPTRRRRNRPRLTPSEGGVVARLNAF
jgi:hypothetical protein